jgi:hypothetical protein
MFGNGDSKNEYSKLSEFSKLKYAFVNECFENFEQGRKLEF